MLILLSMVTNTFIGVMVVLLLWSFSAWSSGPTQQYHLTTIEPEASGVMLGLNQSMMQLSMAAGAGIGGVAIQKVSLASITWIGAAGVAIAIIAMFLLYRMNSRTEMSIQY